MRQRQSVSQLLPLTLLNRLPHLQVDDMTDIVDTLLAATELNKVGKPLVANRCVFNCFKSVEK